MDLVFRSLASLHDAVEFFRVEAEAFPDLSRKFGVNMVPTCVLLSKTNDLVERVEGEDPARLTQAVSNLSAFADTQTKGSTTTTAAEIVSSTTPSSLLNHQLSKLVRASEVMLFMKGDEAKPRCGFSRQVVEILKEANVIFGTFDILTDDEVRQGLKKFSDWPTYPQIYVHGELIGGLDVLKEMVVETTDEETSLADALGIVGIDAKATTPEQILEDRLRNLVARSRIMLFMKGLPSQPQCGFSRQIVELLDGEKVSYDSFNILEDNNVRQGLKKMFDWPTFPQLYVDGEFMGGLDVVKEMKEGDELGDLLRGDE